MGASISCPPAPRACISYHRFQSNAVAIPCIHCPHIWVWHINNVNCDTFLILLASEMWNDTWWSQGDVMRWDGGGGGVRDPHCGFVKFDRKIIPAPASRVNKSIAHSVFILQFGASNVKYNLMFSSLHSNTVLNQNTSKTFPSLANMHWLFSLFSKYLTCLNV